MKLKHMLTLVFLGITLIPVVLVSVLLYQSGFNLAKESYARNLRESIHVQSNYIAENIQNNMVTDRRFTQKFTDLSLRTEGTFDAREEELLAVFQSYLENSEDELSVSVLLDAQHQPIYSLGEQALLERILPQMKTQHQEQEIVEIDLGDGIYSLGISTAMWDDNGTYIGSLVSVYNKSHLFKSISSYYEVADTSTYICRQNGAVVSAREGGQTDIEGILGDSMQGEDGILDLKVEGDALLGYYRNIGNTPWYLLGFVDHQQIYAFINQFIWIYILLGMIIFVADLLLAVYFSNKVVDPLYRLIRIIENYPESVQSEGMEKSRGYVETKYLFEKFFGLMRGILMAQHNYEGIYQLYQSAEMQDINIDIDVKAQTIHSNKPAFEGLMLEIEVPENACIVERFTNCFSSKDQVLLMGKLETMRDKQLSVAVESDVFTPHLGERWFHSLIVPMYEDERLSRLFIQLRDITGFKRQEQASLVKAQRDPLTELYNRAGFLERVEEFLQESQGSEYHGLLFIDMNDFKLVNDNFGHSAGDELLCSIARRTEQALQPRDLVARFGGDEFAIFLPHGDHRRMVSLKERLEQVLIFPYQGNGVSFAVSASVGMAQWSLSSHESLHDLLKRADVDMYQNKRKKKEMYGKIVD